MHGPLYTVCDVDRENDSHTRHSNSNASGTEREQRRAETVEKIAVKCCKVTTVYIRSWIAEESTRVFQFRI